MADHTTVHVVFRPKWGPDFQMLFHIKGIVLDPTDANLQLVISAINAVTRAVAIEIALSVTKENTGSPTASVNYVNEDKAFVKALDAEGQAHNFKIPSLLSTLLGTDKETVNIATGVGSDYATALTTYARSPGGSHITSVPSAYRTENRKRIKAGALI